MAVDLGDVYALTVETRDSGGVLANAGSVVLTIQLPDGTEITPSVSNPSAGRYQVDYLTVQSGLHLVHWDATGANASAYADSFHVLAEYPRTIVSLAEQKSQLGITSTGHDEELRLYLEAVTGVIERETDQTLVRRTITQFQLVRYGDPLILGHTPVLSLTSVATADGATIWTVGNLHADPASGIVRVLSGPSVYGYLRVIYAAGAATVKPEYRLACAQVVQDLWQTRRGPKGSPRAGGQVEEAFQVDVGFVTRRVRELLGKSGPVVR